MENEAPSNSIPVFGYFCIVQPDGSEKILVNYPQEGEQWQFPIKGTFDATAPSVEQGVSNLVSSFIDKQKFSSRGELQSSGLAPFEINLVKISPNLSPAYFFKACVQKEIGSGVARYKWVDKANHFVKYRDACLDTAYCNAIHEEKVYPQAGLKVLDCVDMLVFRKNEQGVKFLMLKREDPLLSVVGWEYSKGPLLYHENHREAAARELKEETGLDISNYEYITDLGFQTVNVAWRKKSYDTLHLLAMTYLFVGDESRVVAYKKEGLRTPTWMTWEDAREKVWMKDYGPTFFDRWKEHEAEILKA